MASILENNHRNTTAQSFKVGACHRQHPDVFRTASAQKEARAIKTYEGFHAQIDFDSWYSYSKTLIASDRPRAFNSIPDALFT